MSSSSYEVTFFCSSISITPSILWGSFFLTLSAYYLLIYSSSVYLLSFLSETTTSSTVAKDSRFLLISGVESAKFFQFLPAFLLLVVMSWSGPVTMSGFGHLAWTSFERKIMMFIFISFIFYLSLFLTSANFSNSAVYDYVLTVYQFTFWLTFLFLSTNILTLSFVVEVLTSLVTLLLITSYNNASQPANPESGYFNSLTTSQVPSTYFYSLLTFFWTSLLTTLTLFLFLVLVYTKFLTVEWSLVSLITGYFAVTATPMNLSIISFSWSLVLLVVFLKCAITPFYLWKPTFFKGLPYLTLFFYIFIFYFFIFLFFINFLLGLYSDLLVLNTFLLLFVLVLSTFILPSILYETLNLKTFFALSSIMNSVIILFAVVSTNSTSLYPLL